MAAAIGIDQLAPDLAPSQLREGLVAALGITAALLAWYAWRRWVLNERTMRNDAELTLPHILVWLSGGLATGILLTLAALMLL